jgi:hypothetical protein
MSKFKRLLKQEKKLKKISKRAADMIAARREQDIFNSRLKRGEVDNPHQIVRTLHVICGCGAQGCVFISVQRDSQRV